MDKKIKRTRTVWNREKFLENMGMFLGVAVIVWVLLSFVHVNATNLQLDVRREPVWWNLIDIIIKFAPKN